jgi:hypothetical protein
VFAVVLRSSNDSCVRHDGPMTEPWQPGRPELAEIDPAEIDPISA